MDLMTEPLEEVTGVEGFRLSPQQKHLWRIGAGRPDSPYRVQGEIRVEGLCNEPALVAALGDLADLHEILRTAFECPPSVTLPLQVIREEGSLQLREEDLSPLSAAEQDQAIEEILEAEWAAPLDPSKGTPWRSCLVRLAPERRVVILTLSGLAADRTSVRILLRDLSRAYAARVQGGVLELSEDEEPMQFADVTDWQHEMLESEPSAAGRAYWQSLEVEIAQNVPAPFRPRQDEVRLSQVSTSRLIELASTWKVRPDDLVLACWRAYLWRLRGHEATTWVGVAIEGRKFAELASAVGPLTRLLPLGGEITGELSLRDLVLLGRQSLEEMQRWQEAFGGLAGGAGTSEPWLPFAFESAETPEAGIALSGLKFSMGTVHACGDRATARLLCGPIVEDLELTLEWDAAQLEVAEAERLLSGLVTLLEAGLAKPEVAIEKLPLLGAEEVQLLLTRFNDTATEFEAGEKLLHQLFEEQVDRTPDQIAVIFEEQTLSYRELDTRANQLAHRLRSLGVGPDVRVAIAAGRSLEVVIALFGVLKAGGCYVPLDPEYPVERITRMIEDAQPGVVVAQRDVAQKLEACLNESTTVICLDTDETLGEERTERPSARTRPDSLAYVLFTSGSTGRPKGAMISHRAIVNHMLWMGREQPLTTEDRVIQKTPFSFDASVWEFYAPLLAGGTLVIARPAGHQDAGYLVQLMEEQQVTVLQVVPTLLRLLLNEPGFGGLASLRTVYCGGEALTADLVKRFYEASRAQLINVYGPSEATIHSTSWPCNPRTESLGSVAIGRPIANVRTYLLDRYFAAAPLGVPGELYVGGASVGRGYLSRPGLTAERYLPDPWSGEVGARLYRTGDLTRWRPDGVLDFLGRLDHQVKLRGFRIELGEIEAVLLSHPAVTAAVAVIHRDEREEPRLVAYWVPKNGQGTDTETGSPSLAELRSHLAERLPDYMVPAFLIRLEQLPQTPNGKLDRKALPDPSPADLEREQRLVLPRNLDEEVLASIWSEVLGVDVVGVHDNFFALGADSIRAVRVVALAKERDLSLTLPDLFELQTIAELSGDLQRRREEERGTPPFSSEPFELISAEDRTLLPSDVEDAYPMTSLQLGMLYHMQMNPDAPSYHNITSFLVVADFSPQYFRRALERVIARHPILRTGFDMNHYSEPMQLVLATAEVPLEVEDLRGWSHEDQDARVEALVDSERTRPFDLMVPPLLRFFVHQLADRKFWLTVVENHAILDGWSLTSILREVMETHNVLFVGTTPPEEAPLQTTFRDFVKLERQALESEQSRSFWREKVRDARPIVIPRWTSALQEDIGLHARNMAVPLSDELCEGLKKLARSSAVPLKSVCLAAHLKVLSLISGQDDVISGLPTHGRPETVDGERVRGLFLNTIPFRLHLDEEETWRDLIVRVFEGEREFVPHRRYPLSAINQNWHDRALFEVLFSFVQFHHLNTAVEKGELKVEEDYKGWESNHYTFMCGFNQHPPSMQLKLRLYWDATELSEDQVRAYGEGYRKVLEAMVNEPDARHQGLEVFQLEEEVLTLLKQETAVADLDEGFSF